MIPWLDPHLPPHFPDTKEALAEPNGLLAAGGQLDPQWLQAAYRRGIFPWFNENEPIMWWTPAPRTVLFPEEFTVNRSFRKFLNRCDYKITVNQRFSDVMQACAEPRTGQAGSWITPAMIKAYRQLHEDGHAVSYECMDSNNILVGGLYGVAFGKMFFGESMFSRADYASRCCLKHLVEHSGYRLIDCQMNTEHLAKLGARDIDRKEFETLLTRYTESNNSKSSYL